MGVVSAAESLLTYRMSEFVQTFQAIYPDVKFTLHADVSRKIMAAELAGQQILLTERTCSYRALLERTLNHEGGRIDGQLEFASVEALKQCAIARMGVAVLPELVVEGELQRGALVALSWLQKPIYVYATGSA